VNYLPFTINHKLFPTLKNTNYFQTQSAPALFSIIHGLARSTPRPCNLTLSTYHLTLFLEVACAA